MFIEKMPDFNSESLKKIREARGLSLEDLFKQTRVRVIYLQAIENKEFHLLPLPVYSRNFIKIYARTVGIDSQPIMSEYEEYLQSRQDQTVQPEKEVKEKFSLARLAGKKTYLLIAIILIIVIVGQWLISKQDESPPDPIRSVPVNADVLKDHQEAATDEAIMLNQQMGANAVARAEDMKPLPDEKKTDEKEEQKKTVPVAGNVLTQPVSVRHTTDDNGAALLTIRATEETWLRVKPDESPSFQIILKAGDKFEHKAKSFDLDIGNAAGIKIKFKDRNIENLGKTER